MADHFESADGWVSRTVGSEGMQVHALLAIAEALRDANKLQMSFYTEVLRVLGAAKNTERPVCGVQDVRGGLVVARCNLEDGHDGACQTVDGYPVSGRKPE